MGGSRFSGESTVRRRRSIHVYVIIRKISCSNALAVDS